MNKQTKITTIIVVAIIVIIAICTIVAVKNKGKEGSSITIESVEDIKEMFDKIYSNKKDELPSSLEVQELDETDEMQVTSFTGLQTNENVDKIVVMQPMMSSQAYSAVAIKVKTGADIEDMKQQILDNVNMNKWLCVFAEKLYVTNYKDVIFFVMADEEWANITYNEFKSYVNNNIGKELEKNGEENTELPPEVFAQ